MAIVDETLWRTLSPLLDRALDLEGAERTAFVQAVEETAPETAAVLARLLAEHERALASGFLATSPGSGAVPSLAGQTLGPYTLVGLLGTGGMGAVWRARRSDGRFEGDVAVKLLHPSLLDRDGEARFRREGTILSRLTQPGIARLFDAGVSNTGQPYLVLELVEGTRIDRWADAQALSVHARIDLFLQVAEAVAHAHANLVVHRDLKPSNILVDREGRVKLLDFGIASLLDESAGAPAARTVTSARALTPEYAAPEQLDGRPVTTATDVYALGVLLYELLAGSHPTLGEDTTPAGLVRAVTQTVPPRMSESVHRIERAGPATLDPAARFATRSTTRERLAKTLAGDLDTIVATALKKAPEERYPTVAAFAEDLRRFLHDLPVKARPDSAWYRARKFVARHRLEAGAAAIAVAALVAATAIAFLQARASARQRDRALADLSRAEITNDLSSFLLSEATPEGTAAGKPVPKSALWARGVRMIDRRFAGDPALQAHLLLLIVERYEDANDHSSARPLIARALDLARQQPDARLIAIATCQMAYSTSLAGDSERADALLAEAYAALERASDSERELASCLTLETDIAYHREELPRAIAAGERALAIERGRHGPPGRALAILNGLGMVYAQANHNADSDRNYGELFAELEAQGRERTVPAYLSRSNWALSLQWAGQFVRALEQWEQASLLARELYPERGLQLYELRAFGAALGIAGRHDEAIAVVDEMLAKVRAASSAKESKGDLVSHLVIAGRVYAEAGRKNSAVALLDEADALLAKEPDLPAITFAARDRSRAVVLLALADTGTEARAAELARSAVERLDAAKRSNFELLPALLVAARADNERGSYDAGLAAAERALDYSQESQGDHPHSREAGVARLEIARARAGRGESALAREAIAAAIADLQPTVGERGPEFRRAAAVRDQLSR